MHFDMFRKRVRYGYEKANRICRWLCVRVWGKFDCNPLKCYFILATNEIRLFRAKHFLRTLNQVKWKKSEPFFIHDFACNIDVTRIDIQYQNSGICPFSWKSYLTRHHMCCQFVCSKLWFKTKYQTTELEIWFSKIALHVRIDLKRRMVSFMIEMKANRIACFIA